MTIHDTWTSESLVEAYRRRRHQQRVRAVCALVRRGSLPHPFIERLIGTLRREYLDQTFFWNGLDLHRKLNRFAAYYNLSSYCPTSLCA
jgi:hypothetical protein